MFLSIFIYKNNKTRNEEFEYVCSASSHKVSRK